MATLPRDRTGEVWECSSAIFVITGPPRRHPALGWQHPYLILTKDPENADMEAPETGVVQENVDDLRSGSIEDRGWLRLA